jgi:hypothetical protein
MKRIGIVLALAFGVGAAAWGAAWWWAAQTMTSRLDAEIAALAEAGVAMRAESRALGGFPFRLDLHQQGVTLTARSGLWRLDVDEAVTSASVFAPDRISTTVGGAGMARVGTLDIAEDGSVLARLALGAEGLVVETPLDRAAPLALVTARTLSLVDIAGTTLREALIDFEGLSMQVERHAAPTVAENGHRLAVQAARLAVAVAPLGDSLRRTELTATDIRLEGTLAGLRGSDLASALAAPGRMALAIESADATLLSLAYAPLEPGATVDFQTLPVAQALRLSGHLGQQVTVADGRIAVETGGNALSLDIAHPAFGGRFAIPEASGRFVMPLRDLPLPEPFALELRLADVRPDEETWAEIDPRDRLDRGPIALVVDISGEARLLSAPPGGRAPGAPVRVDRIDIEALDFSGLGSTATLTGTLLPVAGQPEPDGTLSLRLEGWSSLLRALETVGLLDPVQTLLVAEVAAALKDPARDDALRAEVEMSGGSLVVNGRRYR